MAATRHFNEEFPTLQRKYSQNLQEAVPRRDREKKGPEKEISNFPKLNHGRPLTLGELDDKVQ